MNDAGFGVFLTNLGRYNEGDLVGRWYGLEDFPLAYDRVARDIELNEMYEEYFITDHQGCPSGMGEYVSIDELNELAEWISDQIDEGFSEEDICALLSNGPLTVEEVVDGSTELRLYTDIHTMTEVAWDIWENGYSDCQEVIDSWGDDIRHYVTFDAEMYGRDLLINSHFVDTPSGIFEIVR